MPKIYYKYPKYDKTKWEGAEYPTINNLHAIDYKIARLTYLWIYGSDKKRTKIFIYIKNEYATFFLNGRDL